MAAVLEYVYVEPATHDPHGQARRGRRKPFDLAAPPVRVVCYLCGRQAGTKSLPFHHRKCVEKWDHTRAPLPFPPDAWPVPDAAGAALNAYNAEAQAIYDEDRRNGGFLKGSRAAARHRTVQPPAPKDDWVDPSPYRTKDAPDPPPPPRKTAVCRRCGETYFRDDAQRHDRECNPLNHPTWIGSVGPKFDDKKKYARPRQNTGPTRSRRTD